MPYFYTSLTMSMGDLCITVQLNELVLLFIPPLSYYVTCCLSRQLPLHKEVF